MTILAVFGVSLERDTVHVVLHVSEHACVDALPHPRSRGFQNVDTGKQHGAVHILQASLWFHEKISRRIPSPPPKTRKISGHGNKKANDWTMLWSGVGRWDDLSSTRS